jgi:hypothetical protein
MKGVSIEQMAADLNFPVFLVKSWCGQPLTLPERFKCFIYQLRGGA